MIGYVFLNVYPINSMIIFFKKNLLELDKSQRNSISLLNNIYDNIYTNKCMKK
jgi:hypothetical protein